MTQQKNKNRCKIYNQIKFKQSILFEDLLNDLSDKRTGTDIDYMWENGEIYIFVEVKEYGKKIPTGQKILFERLSKDIVYKKVYCFVLWHNNLDGSDIPLRDCLVAGVYWGNTWIDYRYKNVYFKTAFNKIIK